MTSHEFIWHFSQGHVTLFSGFVVFSVLLYWYWICVNSSLLKWLFGAAWSWFQLAWCLYWFAQLCCFSHKYSMWPTRWSYRKCPLGGHCIGTLLCIGKYPLCLHKKYWSCCCLKPGSESFIDSLIYWFIVLMIHWRTNVKSFFWNRLIYGTNFIWYSRTSDVIRRT